MPSLATAIRASGYSAAPFAASRAAVYFAAGCAPRMDAEDLVGVFFLLEGLAVLWTVLASFFAIRSVLWCCGLLAAGEKAKTS